MKGRITFWVTCVCLVCCIAFTAIHANATLTQLNRSATDDLLRICRRSAEYLDNAAFSPSEEKDAVAILAWTTMFDRLEKCCDSCEDVADTVEQIIMKNS